jgi:FixJ family two-component response regulator
MDICDTRVISVVDDDDSMRRSVRNLLASLGFRVEMFESAEAFVASSQRRNTGCLVLDLRMPGMNGEELLHYLAKGGDPIPTVILSGHADTLTRERLRPLGVLAILCKPFNSDLLLKAVRTAFGKKP